MVEENKYCSDGMKKSFNKDLVITEKDNEDFMNSGKCSICDHTYGKSDVKVMLKRQFSCHWKI